MSADKLLELFAGEFVDEVTLHCSSMHLLRCCSKFTVLLTLARAVFMAGGGDAREICYVPRASVVRESGRLW
jgi:hypothetical protein